MKASSRERDRVIELIHEASETSWQRAHTIAETIDLSSFRCQALAWLTRYAKDEALIGTAEKAMDAAASTEDPYQQLIGSAWVVRALLERERRDEALTMLELGLHAAARIQALSSQSDAIFEVFQAAFEVSSEVRQSLLYALAELIDRDSHPRILDNLRKALVMAKVIEKDFVKKLAKGCADEQRAVIERAIREESSEPRAFFW